MAASEPRVIQVHDSVHGYIPVEGRFMDIVDTPEFQRLRSIEQGSFRPVFPGARHDRFIHSLGTYYLATRFVDHFFRNLEEDEKIKLDPAEETLLRTTFRYAALLHDVGHAPFSHTTENLFKEPTDPDTRLPLIWLDLCREVDNLPAPADPVRFRKSTKKSIGAAHEIMSAILLLRNHAYFTKRWKTVDVDPELAARMIIGYTYSPKDVNAPATQQEIEAFGVRNCLIQMLNSKIMDVDRMDYLGRDTMMSGFINAPVDLECLGRSVTAVKVDGWLEPAFRDEAIHVIDTMFHAKLSHDAWVLAHPAGAYDAALREHCIRQLDRKKKGKYISKVFTADALGTKGVTAGRKTYRLLCDADIITDLKAQTGKPFDELFTRLPGKRRFPAWRTYFEYRHLFDVKGRMNADDVYTFFQELLAYMADNHIFEFTPATFNDIMKIVPRTPEEEYTTGRMKLAANFLNTFMTKIQKDPAKVYSVVLLQRSNHYTMTIDPGQVRIRFTNSKLPLSPANRNYSTFADLRNITEADKRTNNYFYLYRHSGFSSRQLETLREDLLNEIAPWSAGNASASGN